MRAAHRAREGRLVEAGSAQHAIESDAADVPLAAGGDREAFERLYRRHVGRIHGLARRMAGLERADDLTQDVFVRTWQRLASFRGEARFGTWLHRLAVNVIIEDQRKIASRPRAHDDSPGQLERLAVPAADTAATMDFGKAVDRLPPGARQVFVLHDVEGFKHHEIGRLTGIAVGTSKGQLFRARMMLRRFLAGDAAGAVGADGE